MSDSYEVKDIISALTSHIKKPQLQLDAQAIGNALYGLQKMSDSDEVKALLSALTSHINPQLQLSAQHLSLIHICRSRRKERCR